jgi:type-F conjugative transfer system pilin acetylase TraX
MAMFDPHSGKIRVTREVVRFTPMQQDVVKFLALVLMVVDHANRALGLHEPVLMLLGRGAFPLFALLWGYNLAQRPVSQSQANRLWLWSFLAQPAYWLALRHSGFFWYDPNILFVFAVVTQALVFAWRPTGRGEPHGVVVAVAIVGLWGGAARTVVTAGWAR